MATGVNQKGFREVLGIDTFRKEVGFAEVPNHFISNILGKAPKAEQQKVIDLIRSFFARFLARLLDRIKIRFR